MKTIKHRFLFLFSSLFFLLPTLMAQSGSCPGVTASITNGPLLNLCSGSSINLTAAGTHAFYQWQIQTTAGGPFEDITGASTGNYQTNRTGAYRVIAGNGSCKDTSAITTIVQIALEGGTISGGTSNSVCRGELGGIITGSEVPGSALGIVTFSWEMNVNNGGWTTIADAHNIDHIVGPLFNTTAFRRVAKDNCGNTAYSNIITLTAAPAANPGAIAPASQTISSATTPAPFTSVSPASGGSGNFRYQWQSSHSNRGGFADIAGATSTTYAPGRLNRTTYFQRVAIDNTCNTETPTEIVVINITDAILAAGDFATYSSCVFPGGMPQLLTTLNAPSGGTEPYTVEWQSSTDNINFTTIPGATGATYQPGPITQNTWFRKKVTDANGTVAFSPAEMITLFTTPLNPGTIVATTNYSCLGSEPPLIKSATSASGFAERLRYQWQSKSVSNPNWTDIPNQIRGDLLPDPITEKTWFRRIAIDACGYSTRQEISNEVEIEVLPELLPGNIGPATQTVYQHNTPRMLTSMSAPSGGSNSYTVWWEQSSLAVGPWTTVPNANDLTYQPGQLSNTTYFRRAIKDNSCLAVRYSYVIEVRVVTAPALYPGYLVGSTCVFPGNRPGRITTGGPVVSGGIPPYRFQWESRTGNTGPFVAINGATEEAYHPDVITSTTQYRRRVTDAAGQEAYSDTITINYWTTTLMPGTIAATNTTVCPGSTPGMINSQTSMSGYGEAAMYQWQMSTNGTTWTDIAGEIHSVYQPGAITQRTWFRRAASDMCSGVRRWVYSNVVILDLAANVPFKTGLVDGPFITCAGTAPGVIRSVLDACGAGNLTYQWEMNNGSGWNNISGANSASYTPGAINVNTQYRRKVTDVCGNTGYSNTVEIFVYPPIESGVIGTAMQTVCANAMPARLSLLDNCHYTDGTVSYQWQSATSMSGPWTNINGATSAEYQPQPGTTTMYYRLQVNSTTCSFQAYTNVATVAIDASCRTSNSPAMTVYPNPTMTSSFTLKTETQGKLNVTVQNVEGVQVPVSVTPMGNGLIRIHFTNTPSKGLYLVTLFDEKGKQTQKVMVQ